MKRPYAWLKWTARILLVVWAGFWIWFNVVSGISEVSEHGTESLGAHIVVALFILVVAAMAWFRPLAGGIALLGLAAVSQGIFAPGLEVALLLVVPPAVTGVLFILYWWLSTRPPKGATFHSDAP